MSSNPEDGADFPQPFPHHTEAQLQVHKLAESIHRSGDRELADAMLACLSIVIMGRAEVLQDIFKQLMKGYLNDAKNITLLIGFDVTGEEEKALRNLCAGFGKDKQDTPSKGEVTLPAPMGMMQGNFNG